MRDLPCVGCVNAPGTPRYHSSALSINSERRSCSLFIAVPFAPGPSRFQKKQKRAAMGLALPCVLVLVLVWFVGQSDAQSRVPALIVFGDSTVDPGNNNYVRGSPMANFPPYGRDFPGRVPTGRFSNGRLPSDFLASALGIKDTIPAYLAPNLSPRDLTTGVSFGSTASGYDPQTSQTQNAISLTQQLNYFREYQSRLAGIVGAAEAQRIISESLYLVSTGSADIGVSYFYNPYTAGSGRRASQFTLDQYIDFLIGQATSFFQQLYNLGARRILVSSQSILGCTPVQRTNLAIEGRPCNERINQAALDFNRRFAPALQSLQRRLPGSNIVFSNNYDIFVDAVTNPGRYGFFETTRGCCGTGFVEVGVACGSARFSCPNANLYVYWDSVHPSQRMYQILTQVTVNNDLPRVLS